MFTIFLRAVLLYALLIAAMRALGKRQLGEFQPYELALTILLAELIAEPVKNVSTPLAYGLLPVLAVTAVNGLLSIACMKWDGFRAAVSGRPIEVIRGGVIDRRALDRLCLSLADLLEGLRSAGFPDPSEVDTAVVEANGSISAFPNGASRPPRADELGLDTGGGLPVVLVMDGRVQKNNLRRISRSEAWLNGLLGARGLAPAAVYLASMDPRGGMLLQLADGSIQRFRTAAGRGEAG